MAIKQTQLSSFGDQLRDYREKNQEALSTLATFDAEDFASLQVHHLTAAHPEPAEYRDLLNKYNLYLTRLLKKFAQDESHGLKSFLDENNRLHVLEKEEICRMMILTRSIFRKTVQKGLPADFEEVEELYSHYDRYLDSLRKMAAKAQERGMDCWLLQDPEDEEVSLCESCGLRQRTTNQTTIGTF